MSRNSKEKGEEEGGGGGGGGKGEKKKYSKKGRERNQKMETKVEKNKKLIEELRIN